MKNYFVSIIIPALNAEKYIGKCLQNISRLTIPNDQYEVIVVDNGSTDSTIEIVKLFDKKINIKILSKPDVNVSAVRNYGAKAAKGDILIFLDADCLVEPEWAENGTKTIREYNRDSNGDGKNSVAIVASPLAVPENSTWIGRAWGLVESRGENAGEVDWLPSGNMFVLKNPFEDVGGFDERLETSEDCDLCYRLKDKGYKIFSNPRNSVIHLGTPQTLSSFFKRELWHGRAVFKVFLESGFRLKNIKVISFAMFYIVCFFGLVISLIYAIITKHYLPLIGFVCFAIFLPYCLALKTLWGKKQKRHLLEVGTLYLVYGIARAICIINFSWRHK